MCKEIKRLTLLSKCTHLSKTDRDSITWAIQQIEPPAVAPDKGFDGFDFSSWPELPRKSVFDEYDKVRNKKHSTLMTQAWINTVAQHLIQLAGISISVNQALEVATASGWRVIKFDWVKNQLQGDLESSVDDDVITNQNIKDKIKSGNVTHITQIPKDVRDDLDSALRFDRIKNEKYRAALLSIGFGPD
jgi:hypothetical protein